MKTFMAEMMRKGFSYGQALRLARVIQQCRRTRLFYSIEITASYAVVYTEWGTDCVVPKHLPSLRGTL